MEFINEIERLMLIGDEEALDRYFILSVPKSYKFDVAEHFMNGKWLAMIFALDPDYEYLDTEEKRKENFHSINEAVKKYQSPPQVIHFDPFISDGTPDEIPHHLYWDHHKGVLPDYVAERLKDCTCLDVSNTSRWTDAMRAMIDARCLCEKMMW